MDGDGFRRGFAGGWMDEFAWRLLGIEMDVWLGLGI